MDIEKKKPGRPKGSSDIKKRKFSRRVKEGVDLKLERDLFKALESNNFNLIEEFFEQFSQEKEVFDELHVKVVSKTERVKITSEEWRLYYHLDKMLAEKLTTLINKTFPSLKAIETEDKNGNTIQLNLNIAPDKNTLREMKENKGLPNIANLIHLSSKQ